MSKSKRFNESKKKIDSNKKYSLEEAVSLLKQSATAKFDETIELHVRTGIDPRKGDQQIRGTVVLPHGTGKKIRVAAFVDSANETAAKDAGADIVATEETIDEIVKTGKIDFDVAVAVPSMMPKLAKAARVLGPRGLMPNPKTDTVSPNVAKMIQEQKGGKTAFKNDNTSNVHAIAGKASFTEEQIKENLLALIEAVKKTRPSSTKGIFMKSVYITSTMGPSIAIDSTSL
jgi:large subunit ribosomal protein L1